MFLLVVTQGVQVPMSKVLLSLRVDFDATIDRNTSYTICECLSSVAVKQNLSPIARLLVELGVSVEECQKDPVWKDLGTRTDEVLRDERGKYVPTRPNSGGWISGVLRVSWVGRDF